MEREQTSTAQPLETAEAQCVTDDPSNGRSCCCCILSFLLLSLSVLAAAALAIIFVLKPKKPTFQVQSVYLDPLKLSAANGATTIVSVLFSTGNPNKVGIMYRSSRLWLVHGGKAMGMVDVPTFYQPPRSANLSVLMHAVLGTADVGEFVREGLEQMASSTGAEVRIVGGVGAQLHVFSFNLPKFEVSLDCRINVKNEAASLSRELRSIKTQKALVFSNFPHISQKCSFGLLI